MNKKQHAIMFAEALLNDFEMSVKKDGDTLCWQLCGTQTKLSTKEVYEMYIDEIKENNKL